MTDKAVDIMQYRRLGQSDLRVSMLGLGASGLGTRADLHESHRILNRARDAGMTLIDTANVYGPGGLRVGDWHLAPPASRRGDHCDQSGATGG